MKQIFWLLLIIFNTYICFAQTPLLEISPSFQVVDKDSIFSVDIRINDITALHIYSVELKYNKNLLRYSSLEQLDFFSDYQTFFYKDIDSLQGIIQVDEAILGPYAESGSGGLFRVYFKALEFGSDEFYFQTYNLRDTSNSTIDVDTTNSILSIEPINSVEREIQTNNYMLYNNYPNPFNPTTTIKFAVKDHSYIKIEIFNIIGEKIRTLINKEKYAGIYEVRFDASGLPSGIYIYKMTASNSNYNAKYVNTGKMLLIK